ncbi:alpha/beta hydrolase [Pseudochelatococcus sp. B33]
MDDTTDSFAARARAMFEFGSTAVFALKADPRFSYCLYVPQSATAGSATELVVAMHGTGRTFTDYRDAFSEFGRWNDCIILCPLFPVGVRGDDNRDGFKYLREADIRYDRILNAMVDEVGLRYARQFNEFALFGYSGGGHFVHRYFMLNPGRLWALSIGAPGSVTLLDPERDWWVGVRDVETIFGRKLDLEAMARVPTQMIVGAADIETWEITHQEGKRHWMPGANDAGRTRPERLQSLRASFEKAGISVQFDLIANMAHDGMAAVAPATEFLAQQLRLRRKGDGEDEF